MPGWFPLKPWSRQVRRFGLHDFHTIANHSEEKYATIVTDANSIYGCVEGRSAIKSYDGGRQIFSLNRKPRA